MKNISVPDFVVRRAGAVLALTLLALFTGCSRSGSAGAGELVLSGNIEVTDAQLGFKVPGRVLVRPVSEGDRVRAGQLVARLDDAEQREEVNLRRAEAATAEAALAELVAGSRPQEIAAAEATLRSMEAERDRARLEFARAEALRGKAVIADRDFETARAQLAVAEARVAEAGERLAVIRSGPRTETIQQARARVEQVRAAVALAQTRLDQTQLVSPLSGVVLSHNIEPGEFVSAGTPVLTVADTGHLWVRTYLAQTELGRIRLGQKVTVRTDAFPQRTFDGTVAFISSEAEFTPKTVQTAKERVKLVFRIKVDVANPQDELKAGMPADVVLPPAKA